jgi:hypothetical protein
MSFLPADFEIPTLLETDRFRWVADRWPFRRVAYPGREP